MKTFIYLRKSLLLFAAFVCMSGIAFAQCQKQKNISFLVKNWKYQKYNVKGTYFLPSEKEQQDCLSLKEDMTFCHVDGGETWKGTWHYHPDKNVIVLNYCNRDEVREYKIQKATSDTLVLSFKADWKLEMTLYLTAGLMA